MLDVLKKQIAGLPTREEKLNHLREFLQILILKIIYDTGYFRNLSFVGGTALRILYGLRRFSEDLDFSLFEKSHYNFRKFGNCLHQHLRNYGLEADCKMQQKNAVQNIEIRVTNMLLPLGLSSHKGEKLFVKLEIDSNPPEGAITEMSLVNRTYVFTVTHYDIPSLFATKIHACFFRGFVKGRDFYDLLWYLGKRVKPNFILLNNAIQQTHPERIPVMENNFKEFLENELSKIDFKKAQQDVARFLEDKHELKLIDRKIFLAAL
ncbi:MAG: nucleotidyl transferase AbiEii/AbiGii toxin family protein [Nitrospirae bacterium]|nr:nucleotidyl transferase AbiEii/AbiGii toxin family protein [Nitrospirota bacterium]